MTLVRTLTLTASLCALAFGCLAEPADPAPSSTAAVPEGSRRIDPREIVGAVNPDGSPFVLPSGAELYELPDAVYEPGAEDPDDGEATANLLAPACSMHKLWRSKRVHHKVRQCTPITPEVSYCQDVDVVIVEDVDADYECDGSKFAGTGGNGAHRPHGLAMGNNYRPVGVDNVGTPDSQYQIPCNTVNTCGPVPPGDPQ